MGMVHCNQVLEQTPVFGQVVLLLLLAVVEDNFEEGTVQEDQVFRILEEEGHRVLPVQVEEVVHRSYSMSILDLVLGCSPSRILIP